METILKEPTEKLIDDVEKRLILLKHLSSISGISLNPNIDTKIIIPPRDQFSQFYTELGGQRASMHSMGEILFIQTQSYKIAVGLNAIIEMIAEKYNSTPHFDTGMKVAAKPPFITDMDKIIADKLDWMRAEFGNKVLMYSDPRLEKLCYDYHMARAYLLVVHIEYLKWKESLIEYQIKAAVEQMETEKNQEIRKFQNEYQRKTDAEKSKTIQEITNLRNKNKTLLVTLNEINAQFQSLREENQNSRKDTETTHEKLKSVEYRATEMEAKYIEASKELEDVKTKLKRYHNNKDEWVQVSNKGDTPVWKNTVSKDVFTLPVTREEFETEYQLVSVEGGMNVYTNEENHTIELPESLGDTLTETSTDDGSGSETTSDNTVKTKKAKGLRPNDQKVLDAVNASDHPLTQEEISDLTDIPVRNVTNYTTKLVSRNLITEGYENTKKVYSKKQK